MIDEGVSVWCVTELNDEEGKEKCMLSLLHKLPDINYYTAVYLLEHLLR